MVYIYYVVCIYIYIRFILYPMFTTYGVCIYIYIYLYIYMLYPLGTICLLCIYTIHAICTLYIFLPLEGPGQASLCEALGLEGPAGSGALEGRTARAEDL